MLSSNASAVACPEMTALADLVRRFAALPKRAGGNDVKLTEWITAARAVDLPHLCSLTNGLEIDRAAVDAESPCHTTTAATKASTPAPRGP